MQPRTARFEFETALQDDVSRPFTLSRGIYVLEYAIQANQYALASRATSLIITLSHPRTGHESHRFELTFPEVQSGQTALGRQPLRVAGGPFFLALHTSHIAHTWVRILRL